MHPCTGVLGMLSKVSYSIIEIAGSPSPEELPWARKARVENQVDSDAFIEHHFLCKLHQSLPQRGPTVPRSPLG